MLVHRDLGRLGFVDVLDADYESARRGLVSAVGYARSAVLADYPWALQWLGLAYLGLGDRRAGRATFAELLEITSDAGNAIMPELGVAFGGIARSVEQVDVREGARLAGAVAKLRSDAGGLRSWTWPQVEEIEVRFEQPLIEALGDDEYNTAHEEGRALSFEETLELARSLAAS